MLAAIVLANQQPSDPLDWRVKAKTPEDFEQWSDDNIHLLPPDLAKELYRAFSNIEARTPQSRPLKKDSDYLSETVPFCVRIHHRTIRAVLIDGYSAANETLSLGITLESDNIIKNLKRQETLDAKSPEYERFERKIAAQEKTIAASKVEIEKNTLRLTALAGPPGKN